MIIQELLEFAPLSFRQNRETLLKSKGQATTTSNGEPGVHTQEAERCPRIHTGTKNDFSRHPENRTRSSVARRVRNPTASTGRRIHSLKVSLRTRLHNPAAVVLEKTGFLGKARLQLQRPQSAKGSDKVCLIGRPNRGCFTRGVDARGYGTVIASAKLSGLPLNIDTVIAVGGPQLLDLRELAGVVAVKSSALAYCRCALDQAVTPAVDSSENLN